MEPSRPITQILTRSNLKHARAVDDVFSKKDALYGGVVEADCHGQGNKERPRHHTQCIQQKDVAREHEERADCRAKLALNTLD